MAPNRPDTSRLAAGRRGPGRRRGELGQVVQRVGEMLGAERREMEVLPDILRHRRPVVGERDLGLGRTERRQVVTPEPAAETQVTVAVLRPRPPADGARRVDLPKMIRGGLSAACFVAYVPQITRTPASEDAAYARAIAMLDQINWMQNTHSILPMPRSLAWISTTS